MNIKPSRLILTLVAGASLFFVVSEAIATQADLVPQSIGVTPVITTRS